MGFIENVEVAAGALGIFFGVDAAVVVYAFFELACWMGRCFRASCKASDAAESQRA